MFQKIAIAIKYRPKTCKNFGKGEGGEEFTPECQTSWNKYRGPTSRSEFSHHAPR